MAKTHLLLTAVCGIAATAASANAASVTYTGFTGDGSIPGLSVTADDSANAGKLTFTVAVDTNQGYIADILGFYFNVANDSLVSGLSVVSGTNVTASAFSANSVSNLGGGNNMNGSGGGPYDAGVQFGQSGIGAGKGDYQLVSLVIGHTTEALTVGDLSRVGLRLQSVGQVNSGRGGSSKLYSDNPNPSTPAVPTPAAAGIGLVMLGLGALRRSRR